METRLTLLGIIFFAAGILLLAFLLRRVFKRIRFQDTGSFKSKPPGGINIIFVVVALVMIVLAQGFFWLSAQLKYFRPLDENGNIGRLTVLTTDDPVKSLELRYVPASGDTANAVNVENMFYLSGDSWRVSGEILNFKFARGFFQLPERCYKTTEFNGQFLSERAPAYAKALFHSWEMEGGPSRAFSLFRDGKYLKWFAEVDSFSGDWVTVEGSGAHKLAIDKDGGVAVE